MRLMASRIRSLARPAPSPCADETIEHDPLLDTIQGVGRSLRLDAVVGNEFAPPRPFAVEIGAPGVRRAADRRNALGFELGENVGPPARLRHALLDRPDDAP